MIGRKRILLSLFKKYKAKSKTIKTIDSIEEEPPKQPQNTQNSSNNKQAHRQFHLTIQQAEEKIEKLKAQLPDLEGPDNKKKRQRVYHELSQLQKAVQEPELYLVGKFFGEILDPTIEEEKRKMDQTRRIQKKKIKKVERIKEIRREKKRDQHKICLVCKQVGHIAANCRDAVEIKNDHICYACGSNEHNLRDCPKKQNKSNQPLQFAQCFVCKEIGHISRDCTLNNKGIYPKGGSCYICGGIDHLKQDCPKNPVNKIRNKKQNAYNEEYFDEND